MRKKKIIELLKEHGCDFAYFHFEALSIEQQRELFLSALYVLTNDKKLLQEYYNELEQNLDDD